jgi:hypothetical protein
MARVNYVKHAQQRFKTVPVLDEEGKPKRAQVFRRDGVTPKTTKRGEPIFRKITVEDKTQPLPNRACEVCKTEIKPGMPYKWIQPRSGPYGGHKRFRCGTCPAWQVWDYSHSLGAELARISHEFHGALDDAQSEDDVQGALDDAAQQVEDLAQEKRDSAENMESGFGHATYQSDELSETADSLEEWAREFASATIPEYPEPEETDCEDCTDLGDADAWECKQCNGDRTFTPEEPTEAQIEDWHEALHNDLSVVDESPV